MCEIYSEICNEYIEDIFKCAKKVFCNGIYIKSEAHPCGWDFISFEDFECSDDMFEQPIGINIISGGCYDYHDYKDKTVEELIKLIGMNGWCFEISGVDNLR